MKVASSPEPPRGRLVATSARSACATPSALLETTRPRRIRARMALAAFVMVSLLVVTGISWLGSNGTRQALRELPAVERRALYEKTIDTLRSTCRSKARPAGLADFCHEQAELVLQFPECDAACRSSAQPFCDVPTR